MELRDAFAEVPDLEIVWVMSGQQINERTRAFVDEYNLRDRIRFLSDDKSALIRELGILKPNPEAIEEGVPHPTTFLIDREGQVRFLDVREDFHIWLDPQTLVNAVVSLD